MTTRYLPPQDERGRFVRACRACAVRLTSDDDCLCQSCLASDEYCESCGGRLEETMATIEGYARACECPPRPDPEDLPYAYACRDGGHIWLTANADYGPEVTIELTKRDALQLGLSLVGHAAGVKVVVASSKHHR